MPLPSEHKALLTANPDFSPNTTRGEWQDYHSLWRLYLDLYELDRQKLKALVEPHNVTEDAAKLAKRQALAAVYNLIPMIVDLVCGYIFSEAPAYDVGADKQLQEFLKNCNGGGRPLVEFVRETALPMAQVLGMLDVLVENPPAPEGKAQLVTEADKADAGIRPHVVPVTPLQRIHWSVQPNHAYNWLRYTDTGNEDPNPCTTLPQRPGAYVTYFKAHQGKGYAFDTASWIRSWMAPTPENQATDAPAKLNWQHEGGSAPTERVPVATLYHKLSNDPDRRHWGLSKISMMAVLTVQIIQVLSWSSEDLLANLALFAIPTKNGQPPKDDDGKEKLFKFGPFSAIYYPDTATNVPAVVQGDVSHIEIKLKVVEMHLREILRLANLLQATGSAGSSTEGGGAGGKATSGVQAQIERGELFRELTETSNRLDQFVLEILALAKSWSSDDDWDVERLTGEGKVSVRHYKGPWSLEPVDKLIATANEALALLREASPTAVTESFKQVVRAMLHNNGAALETSLKEIDDNLKGLVDKTNERENAMQEAAVDQAAAAAKQAKLTPAVEGGDE